MRLRQKAVLMILLGFAASLVVTYLVSQTVLMRRFAEMEKHDTRQNTQRAVSALYTDFTSMNITFGTMAFDSGSFRWVQGEQGMHMEINLQSSSFMVMGINYVAFIMEPGQAPMGVGYDLNTGQSIPFPDGFAADLMRPDNPLSMSPQADSTPITGILVLPDTALLVQSFPGNVDSMYGPIKGRMILARFLDAAEVQRLAEQTHLSLALYRWDDSGMPDDFLVAHSRLSDKSPVVTHPLSRDTVAGYGLLNDVYGNPAMIIRADMPRDIYHQGQQTAYWLIAGLAAVLMAFALGVIIVLNRLVLSRLLGLNRSVETMRETHDLSQRVAVDGRDEVSSLGEAINGMLASMEKSQRELTGREAEKYALLNAIPDLMFRITGDGTILDARATETGGPPRAQVRSGEGVPFNESPQYEFLLAEMVHRGLPLVKKALGTRETQMFDIEIPYKGDTVYYEARVAASRENEALVMLRDVTERKRAEKSLEYAGNHDALTGLYNRAYLEREFARIRSAGGPFPVGMVIADVDGMKAVNDSQGHGAGDAMLRRAATVLATAFRAGDLVSRIGGDEFAVLIPGANESAVEKMLARARRSLAADNGTHSGTPLSLSLGGVAGDKGCRLADIMREADNRMYLDKQAKKAAARNATGQPVR